MKGENILYKQFAWIIGNSFSYAMNTDELTLKLQLISRIIEEEKRIQQLQVVSCFEGMKNIEEEVDFLKSIVRNFLEQNDNPIFPIELENVDPEYSLELDYLVRFHQELLKKEDYTGVKELIKVKKSNQPERRSFD